MAFHIDHSLEALIPPLRGDERDALRAALKKAGRATDPLTLWLAPDGTVTLLDGHNRFRLCRELGLPFTTQTIQLPSREAAVAWMFEHQLSRRNLSKDRILVLAAQHGQPRPSRETLLRWQMAQDIVKSPAHVELVHRDEATLTAIHNALLRDQGLTSPKRRAPASAPPLQGIAAAEIPSAAAPAPSPRQVADARVLGSEMRDLQARLVEQERAQDFFDRVHHVPTIKVAASRPKSGKRSATPVTLASDWHVGETVSAEETMGKNHYSLAEAKRRAGNFWDNVMWLRADAKRTQSCDDHVLWIGGDIISGAIHAELVETNEVGLVDQVSEAAALLRPGIEALAADCRKLVIPCSHGNHGRITDKSRIKTGWANSLEVILYRYLKAELKHLENVEWHIPKAENQLIDVMGHKVQLQHGTQIRSQGGIGGILVPLTRWATRAASADLYVFGHFHQAQCFEQVVVNGSLIGDSAYSRANAMSFRDPEQVGFIIDEKRGLRRFERISVT